MKSEKREPELALVAPATREDVARPLTGSGDEITLASLWRTFRRGLWILLATALGCVILSGVWLKLRQPVYTAEMVVAPAERDLAAAGRLTAELEQYASLAMLAQMPDRLEQVSTLDRYLQLMSSVRLAERLETEHGLLRQTFAQYWDPDAGRWRPARGWTERIKRAILGFFGFPEWRAPTPAHLAEYLGDRIDIGRAGTSGLRLLSVSHPDGAFAVQLLGAAHAVADDLLRGDALTRLRAEIRELERSLEEADRPARREALERALAAHYEAEALLSTDQPYAAELVSPPAAGPLPSSMSPFLVLTLAGIVGLILGLFVVFLRDALKRNLA